MKKIKLNLSLCLAIIIAISLIACSGHNSYFSSNIYYTTNTYNELFEQDFIDVSNENNKSFISLSPNSASYTDLYNQIINKKVVSRDSVRIEEMLNYFDYDYSLPIEEKPLSMNATVMDTPWNDETKLLLIGMKAAEIEIQERTNNIVLLIDVSGSMHGSSRLGLAIEGLNLLVDQMKDEDVISIITYAGTVSLLLDGKSGSDKELIKSTLIGLQAGGSTNGSGGINLAYETAQRHMEKCDNSTIIIITDGDFNVGTTNSKALKDEIIRYKSLGISFSSVGVGYGNMRSDILEEIADAGGGRFAYLASVENAQKFFVEELGSLFNIVAKDAKAEIVFNEEVISKYRIIGYENRQLSEEEWNDENTNAGSIGNGLVVTAVFEIIITENSANYAQLNLRYKHPETLESLEDSMEITQQHNLSIDPLDQFETRISFEDAQFISAVIETGLLLRNSSYKGSASYQSCYARIKDLQSVVLDSDKYNFVNLLSVLISQESNF